MARTKHALSDRTRSSDLTGNTYIVTGANSGVGLETTRQLVKQGGHVVLACRRVDAGNEVAATMNGLAGSTEVLALDLASLASVRAFVEAYRAKHEQLHGLACNAGFVNMTGDVEHTEDGLESTIGVSYFGHFLLAELLLETLRTTPDSRMVILSSVVHAGSPKNRPQIDFHDINYKTRKFSGMNAYAEAKVATVLYATELAARLGDSPPAVFSVHPGWARSNFGSGGSFLMNAAMTIMRPLTRFISDSNEESAQTSLHCLISDEAPQHSGGYFSQSSVLYRDKGTKDGGWPMKSPNPNATDMDTARRLVDLSYELVGLDKP